MSIYNDATKGEVPWWDIRNKVLNKKKNRTQESKSWSSYWMDDDSYDYFYDSEKNTAKVKLGKSKSTIDVSKAARLAAVRRAVSNFVQILTNNDNIKVAFSSGKDSYTTGDVVVISAEDNPEKFDVVVGTALHEAAHCVFTKPLMKEFGKISGEYVTDTFKYKWLEQNGLNLSLAEKISFNPDYHIQKIHLISNFLEDRRIDMEVFTRSPGYRPYYQSMYDHIWNSKEIAKALIYNLDLRIPNMKSYEFRLINLTNPASKLTFHHLRGMKEIYNIVELNNILRFSDKNGVVVLDHFIKTCVDIYNVIIQHIVEYENELKQENDSLPNYVGGSVTGNVIDDTNESENESDLPNLDFSDSISSTQTENKDDVDLNNKVSSNNDDNEDEESDEIEDEDDDIVDSKSDENDRSDEDIEKEVSDELGSRHLGKKDPDIDELLEDLKEFVNGNISKRKVSEQMNNVIQATEESNTTVSSINIHNNKFSFIRIGKLTNSSKSLVDKFIVADGSYFYDKQRELIEKGKRLGQIIVDRIKIRHDNNETKFSRRKLGKIDRRLIHSLGVDNENIFFNRLIESYKNSIFYLTIDCSYSMDSNKKWENSIILATGLTYATTKINNFDIIVNLRYELDNIWSITLFDSRINSFSHYEKWMSRFRINGGTPESIVYEIEKEYIISLKKDDNNVYFITFTDGAPYISSDSGDRFNDYESIKHCKKILNEFRDMDINILSYYLDNKESVDSNYYRYNMTPQESFKQSYGNDGVFIPLENFSMISKSINNLLTKSDRSI